jgi:hypothetical protein
VCVCVCVYLHVNQKLTPQYAQGDERVLWVVKVTHGKQGVEQIKEQGAARRGLSISKKGVCVCVCLCLWRRRGWWWWVWVWVCL